MNSSSEDEVTRHKTSDNTKTGNVIMARLEMNSIDQMTSGGSATSDILYELGVMYAVGRDVEQNLIEAHKWLNIAAFRGSDNAARYRRELAIEMSTTEIAAAQREAREWISLH